MDIVQHSYNLYRWLNSQLNGVLIPADDRSRAAAACLDLAMEHHYAVTALVKARIYGSAFALARCTFEAYVRGTWLKNCASEKQTKKFLKDKLDISFQGLIDELEKLDAYSDGVLSYAKKQGWEYLNSLTHAGAHQAFRRNSEEHIEPVYEKEEIEEIIWFVNGIAILSGLEAASMASNPDSVDLEVFLTKMKEHAKDT